MAEVALAGLAAGQRFLHGHQLVEDLYRHHGSLAIALVINDETDLLAEHSGSLMPSEMEYRVAHQGDMAHMP